jgi:hypothetical protein
MNRKQKNAGRARTRYLTSDGHILKGTELFKPTPNPVLVMALPPHVLAKLRALTLEERKKHFDRKKAWTPAALGAPNAVAEVEQSEEQEDERNQASVEDPHQEPEG